MPRLRASIRQNTSRRRSQRRWLGPVLRAGSVGLALAMLVGVGSWLWLIGWPQQQAERLNAASTDFSRSLGFKIRDVVIDGRERTDRDALRAALQIATGQSLFAFSATDAAAALRTLPWVKDAVVTRRLPDTVYVRLTERQPLARWQTQGRIQVIDSEGEILPQASVGDFTALPLVVGLGAATAAAELLTQLRNHPQLARATVAAVRVGARRWDLQLSNQVIARLPEENLDAALRRLAQLVDRQQILARTVTVVDLRQPDRIVLERPNSQSDQKTASDPRM